MGRDAQVAALEAAFEDALAGRCRGVLVSGAPGVGKTALIDQLRPVVTGRDGWFVAGKFDQYRRDLEFDAVHQAFRALGRLLLAEPEDELAEVRERILAALGPNAGLLTAVVPEFAALLAVPPDPGDPLTAQVRAQRAAVAGAARGRLARSGRWWCSSTTCSGPGAPRSASSTWCSARSRSRACCWSAPTARATWTRRIRWRRCCPAGASRPGCGTCGWTTCPCPSSVAHGRGDAARRPAAAAGLAEVIEPHTPGNPYETVELLNALRRDGVLTATADGWRWDDAAVRAHLGRPEAAGLLAARVEALPPRSRRVVEAMACLGGRAELGLLQTATGEPAGAVEQALAPALDEGLLVVEPGAREAVRFRHDRIREAHPGAGWTRSGGAPCSWPWRGGWPSVPELFAVAAEQYLPVVDAVDDAAERRRVVGLLRRAADQAALIGDHALVNALLARARCG